MTERNIFDVQKRLRSMHNPRLAQAHLWWLIDAAQLKSIWRAELVALQTSMTRRQLRKENSEDRRRA